MVSWFCGVPSWPGVLKVDPVPTEKEKGDEDGCDWPKRLVDCPKIPPVEGVAPNAGVVLGVPNGDDGVDPKRPPPNGLGCWGVCAAGTKP